MLKRCTQCRSLWVCWNWMTWEDMKTKRRSWLHECWNCAACQTTEHKVRTGIPYWVLRHLGPMFADHELFEANLANEADSCWGDEH